MNTRRIVWSRLVAAFIIAIGLQAVWGTLVIWTATTVAQFFQEQDQYYESVAIRNDGEAVIGTRAYFNPLDWSYRTLDGKPLPDQKDDAFLTAAQLPSTVEPPGLIETPVPWSLRIASISDEQRAATAWYVVRDGRRVGAAYMVGYDANSKGLVGYFGRRGFRQTMPPPGEWFDVGRCVLTYGSGGVASTGNLQFGGLAYTYATMATAQQRVPAWLLFLIDGDKVLEIDLKKRSIRTLFESKGLVSIAGLVEDLSPATDAMDNGAPNDGDAAAVAADGAGSASNSKVVARIAVRTANRVVVLDPPTDAKREFTLPESIRDKNFEVFAGRSPQLIVQLREAENWAAPHIYWLNPDGAVAREETVTLASAVTPGKAEALSIGVVAAPLPIGWIAGTFVGAPLVMLQAHQTSTYAEAVTKALIEVWPAVIAVILIGLAMAALTYRLQRKYRRPGTSVWCTFVLLLGWPAFLAYWFEHRRPKLEPCQDCGQIVPRDRDACAGCNKPFVAPPLVGTEIFA